ncbi:MAG: hypothetical protein LPL29_02230 [Alphaproteobacteria bacterium]|nr:hypothetical protein [Alphaproteobacteria bacterium]
MASYVLHRRTLTPGAIPSLAQIQLGELVLNVSDGKVYMRVGDGSGTDTVIEVGKEQITVSATAPASPVVNQLWLDIS